LQHHACPQLRDERGVPHELQRVAEPLLGVQQDRLAGQRRLT